MKEYFLYRHIRLDTNQPFYIGIGTKPKTYYGYKTEYKRAFVGYRRSKYWNNVVSKTDYRVDILFESLDLNEIKQKETEFIQLYGRKGFGTLVNLTDGGELHHAQASNFRKNKSLPKEAIDKIRKANVGRKASDETKKLLSERAKNLEFHKRLQTVESFTKAKKSRRDNSPRVKHDDTKLIFNSLKDGCEHFGLNYQSEWRRINRNSSTKKFTFIDSERGSKNKLT